MISACWVAVGWVVDDAVFAVPDVAVDKFVVSDCKSYFGGRDDLTQA